MKILAIDTSGLVASVAIVEDETLLVEFTVNYKKKHIHRRCCLCCIRRLRSQKQIQTVSTQLR